MNGHVELADNPLDDENTFQLATHFDSPFDQYDHLKGKPFRLVGMAAPPVSEDEEDTLLFVIEFEDGLRIHAWPFEVFIGDSPNWNHCSRSVTQPDGA